MNTTARYGIFSRIRTACSDRLPDFDTGQQPPHIRFTPYLRALTSEVVGKERNPLKKARRIYDFITSQVAYSYMPEYFLLDDIAGDLRRQPKGDCGVQALLFITMCRIARIPARWQSGLSVTAGLRGAARLGAVLHPALRLAVCGPFLRRQRLPRRTDGTPGLLLRQPGSLPHGGEIPPFQAPLVPPKSGLRADPYDNQVGECEIDGKGLLTGQFDFFHEIIDIRSIRQ